MAEYIESKRQADQSPPRETVSEVDKYGEFPQTAKSFYKRIRTRENR